MISVDADDNVFAGTILLSSPQISARAIGYFNASATENRIAGIAGFHGAVILIAEADRRVLELVLWDNPTVFAEARDSTGFGDHIAVVATVTDHLHVCFSPILVSRGPIVFRRGQSWTGSSTFHPDTSPGDVTALLRAAGGLQESTIAHVGQLEGGVVVVVFGTVGASWPPPGAVEQWRHDFMVLETFAHELTRMGQAVPYRLRPGDADASDE